MQESGSGSPVTRGRRRGHRLWLPIAAIVVAAVVAGVAIVVYENVSHPATSPSIASALGITLAYPKPVTGSPCQAAEDLCYVFSVQLTSAGLIWSDISMKVLTAGGVFVPTVNSYSVLSNPTTAVVWAIGPQASTWAGTPGATVSVSQQVAVDAGLASEVANSLAGDQLEVIGVSAYSGSFFVQIPGAG